MFPINQGVFHVHIKMKEMHTILECFNKRMKARKVICSNCERFRLKTQKVL